MKKWLVVVNSILAVPFIYILFCTLLDWVLDTAHLGGMMNGDIAGFFLDTPMILAYVFLPEVGPILFPLLTAFTSFLIWRFWPQWRILLGCNLLVFLLYDIYLVWWYATGQHVEF